MDADEVSAPEVGIGVERPVDRHRARFPRFGYSEARLSAVGLVVDFGDAALTTADVATRAAAHHVGGTSGVVSADAAAESARSKGSVANDKAEQDSDGGRGL